MRNDLKDTKRSGGTSGKCAPYLVKAVTWDAGRGARLLPLAQATIPGSVRVLVVVLVYIFGGAG